MNSTPYKPFTESWLQALTLSVSIPLARSIKPMMDDVNALSRMEVEGSRNEIANRIWNLASDLKLLSLLTFVPTQQMEWRFDSDGPLTFRQLSVSPIETLQSWLSSIGLADSRFTLRAEATSDDWARLVRDEAVRLKKATSASGMPEGKNVQLSCSAEWQETRWQVRFQSPDWLTLRYDDPFVTDRPSLEKIVEALGWATAIAEESFIPKNLPKWTPPAGVPDWISCVDQLRSIHLLIFEAKQKPNTFWMQRTWACVWPIVYREQNVLKGRADLEHLRTELSQCFQNVPKLTQWMFLASKLVASVVLGRGLGICGDFVDG